LNLKGIASRCYAYKGPDLVQLDCTDKCDSGCLACWTHSPLIKNNQRGDFQDLDPAVLKDFIREIKKSGTREICFSGGGEPFLHPNIWEILDFTQELGLPFCINTNFTLLDKEGINKLLGYSKLTSLTVSIWGHEAGLYSQLHGRTVQCFDNVKAGLTLLNRLKPARLNVVICSVISNLNYFALPGLKSLAGATGCNGIEFTLVDVMPGSTEALLLNAGQLKRLKEDFLELLKKTSTLNNGVKVVNQDLFLKRILSPGACSGEYDSGVSQKPCYSGWVFLRLRANGDLNSCRKSHRIPIGNIYKDNFLSIWNNKSQQEFRKKCLSLPRDKEFFKLIGNGDSQDIGCKRVCDNLLINEHARQMAKCLARF